MPNSRRVSPAHGFPSGAAASVIRHRKDTTQKEIEMFNKNGSNNGNGSANGVHKDTAVVASERATGTSPTPPPYRVTGTSPTPL